MLVRHRRVDIVNKRKMLSRRARIMRKPSQGVNRVEKKKMLLRRRKQNERKQKTKMLKLIKGKKRLLKNVIDKKQNSIDLRKKEEMTAIGTRIQKIFVK